LRISTFFAAACAALFLAAPARADVPGGLPSTDRPWTVADIPVVAAALNGSPAANLPSLANSSRPYLERLSERGVLDFCRDRSSPIGSRMGPCLSAFQAQVQILGAYGPACETNTGRDDDCMRVAEALMYGAGVMNQLMEQFIPTIDPNDPTYATRMAGVEQTKQGLTIMVSGAVTMLNERHLYSEAARIRFAAVVAEVYPQVASAFSADARAAFEQSLRDLARSDSSSGIRAALAAFAG
jgi:hypothetical protein